MTRRSLSASLLTSDDRGLVCSRPRRSRWRPIRIRTAAPRLAPGRVTFSHGATPGPQSNLRPDWNLGLFRDANCSRLPRSRSNCIVKCCCLVTAWLAHGVAAPPVAIFVPADFPQCRGDSCAAAQLIQSRRVAGAVEPGQQLVMTPDKLRAGAVLAVRVEQAEGLRQFGLDQRVRQPQAGFRIVGEAVPRPAKLEVARTRRPPKRPRRVRKGTGTPYRGSMMRAAGVAG